ncbi:MAG: hypothetical protein AB1657_03940 [Candidatus Micrarchaeota archaeon]
MRNDFVLSAATEDHSRIEAALGNALKDSRNPALLKELFGCLKLVVDDAHLSDRYSLSIIAAIASVCRNCSGDRKRAEAALGFLEKVFRDGDANIRAYTADAACLLKTPAALRFVLNAAKDAHVLRRCPDIDDRIDEMVGLVYFADPAAALHELGMMLAHPAQEIRTYATHRLLLFGEPGQPKRLAELAHILLAKGARDGCGEARLLLRRGYELRELSQEWPRGFRAQRVARAACSFYERVREGGRCAVPEELWRRIRPEVIGGGGLQRPSREFAAGPKRPELRLVRAENTGARG